MEKYLLIYVAGKIRMAFIAGNLILLHAKNLKCCEKREKCEKCPQHLPYLVFFFLYKYIYIYIFHLAKALSQAFDNMNPSGV